MNPGTVSSDFTAQLNQQPAQLNNAATCASSQELPRTYQLLPGTGFAA